MIVILPPSLEDTLRFDHRREHVRVQALVAQPPVETFDEGMVDGLAGANELEADVVRVAATLMPVSDRSATSANDSRVKTSSTVTLQDPVTTETIRALRGPRPLFETPLGPLGLLRAATRLVPQSPPPPLHFGSTPETQ